MKKHIPNTITCCNLISGCIATYFAFLGNYELALLFIVIGAVFDFFDGMSARLLGVSSPIGKELDSLADDITFGFAPSAIIFNYLSTFHIHLLFVPFLAFVMAAFSALRLAKFNLDERQALGFIGLPTPANALFWGSLIAGAGEWISSWEYAPYHFSNGEKHRRIVMMSGSADLFTDDEMMFVLGHELGHMACGHKPYHMLLETFYMPFVNDAAFKAWASIIKLPLMEWYRISDYTADRMGLLCCQDINAAITTMIKKAGLPKKCYNNIDVQGFIQQAREFEEKFTDTMDRVVKVLSIRSAEFPWLVVRAGKLYDWYHSDEYKQIIDKN